MIVLFILHFIKELIKITLFQHIRIFFTKFTFSLDFLKTEFKNNYIKFIKI